jgi:hypothetical protein
MKMLLVATVLALALPAGAQESPAKSDSEPTSPQADVSTDQDKRTSAELRIMLISAAARWSPVSTPDPRLTQHAKRSLYFSPGIGARVFIKQPHHGFLVDFDYRIDTDIDSINALEGDWKTDFAVARVGYAYRFIRHANERMVWTFTPHASFSAGGSINRNKALFPSRSAVLGGRVGVNVDFHISRFFFGWAVDYEGLKTIRGGPLKASHFLLWTLIPIFRIGVDLGPKIQTLAL